MHTSFLLLSLQSFLAISRATSLPRIYAVPKRQDASASADVGVSSSIVSVSDSGGSSSSVSSSENALASLSAELASLDSANAAEAADMNTLTIASTNSMATAIVSTVSNIYPPSTVDIGNQIPLQTICPSYSPPSNTSSYIVAPFITTQSSSSSDDEDNDHMTTSISPAAQTTTISSLSPVMQARLFAGDYARIVQGGDGCQTIYGPGPPTGTGTSSGNATSLSLSKVASCSTVVTFAAQPYVTVSDCSQMITFSSSLSAPERCTSTSTSTPTPTPVAIFNGTAPSYPVSNTTAYPIAVRGDQDMTRRGLDGGNNTIARMFYYVAGWRDLVSNEVPSNVSVEICPVDFAGGNAVVDAGATSAAGMAGAGASTTMGSCTTSYESWLVTAVTLTMLGESIVTFNGPAVLTAGTDTITTTITLNATVTTTSTSLSVSVVHQRLNIGVAATASADASGSASPFFLTGLTDSAATMEATVPVTESLTLEDTTTTITSQVTITTVVYGDTSTATASVGSDSSHPTTVVETQREPGRKFTRTLIFASDGPVSFSPPDTTWVGLVGGTSVSPSQSASAGADGDGR